MDPSANKPLKIIIDILYQYVIITSLGRQDFPALPAMPARLPRASMGHAVLLTLPSDGNRPSWSYPYTGTLSPLISFVSHSYENTRGVGVFFPFWNSPILTRGSTSSPGTACRFFRSARSAFSVASALNPCFSFDFQPSTFNFQPSHPLSPFLAHSCALFCAFLHSTKSQLFSFQAIPHSLSKTPGVGEGCYGQSAIL
jgi:hypothetical protein